MPLIVDAVVGAAVALALAGCTGPSVVRVIDGREVEGRYISDEAYARYAQAALDDASGEGAAKVLAHLGAAAREDPESAEIWARIAAVYCRAPLLDATHGRAALARARALDPAYAPLFREEARCALVDAERAASPEPKQRALQSALAAAEQAITLDPDDLPSVTLAADLLARLGREADAGRLLAGFVIRKPSSTDALRALHDFARKSGDEALKRRAERRLHALGFPLAGSAPPRPSLDAIDEALGGDDLAAARRLAHRAHLPLSELAVRAAALGRVAAARSQAEVIVGADPSDTSARIALAVALDLAGDTAALGEALAFLAAPPGAFAPPSPLARLLFAELLARRVGAEAARAFLGPLPAPAPSSAAARADGDALHARVELRVRSRLEEAPTARAPLRP